MLTTQLIRYSWMLLPALAGCVSYGPENVAALPTYDICELQVNQAINLTDTSQRLLQTELARRKESCAPHLSAIKRARDEELYDRTYRNQSP